MPSLQPRAAEARRDSCRPRAARREDSVAEDVRRGMVADLEATGARASHPRRMAADTNGRQCNGHRDGVALSTMSPLGAETICGPRSLAPVFFLPRLFLDGRSESVVTLSHVRRQMFSMRFLVVLCSRISPATETLKAASVFQRQVARWPDSTTRFWSVPFRTFLALLGSQRHEQGFAGRSRLHPTCMLFIRTVCCRNCANGELP